MTKMIFLGGRGVASCDEGQLFKPLTGSLAQELAAACAALVGSRLTAVNVECSLKGEDMVCDIIRPEGISRPECTAMQTKPGTGMICDM